MRRFLNQFLPFVFVGFALVALIFGIMLLAYLFFFGAVVGMVLYAIAAIRERFFAPKRKPLDKTKSPQSGRIIDTDDWRKM